MNIQEKEQLIIGTIIECNSEIKKLNSQTNIKTKTFKSLMEKSQMYEFGMTELYKKLDPLFESTNSLPINLVQIKNNRQNYYSYFKSVYKFLKDFEPGIQNNLNENFEAPKFEKPLYSVNSVNQNNQTNKVPETKLDIFSFRNDLKRIIMELSKQDDTDVSLDILKIKVFANKPVFIHGFNISNNLGLRSELVQKFNFKKLNCVVFNKSEKQLIFITDNFSGSVVYDLSKDILDYYNTINIENKLPNKNFDANYVDVLKDVIGSNYFLVFIDISNLKLEFKDNLYLDDLRKKQYETSQKNGIVVKR